MSRISSIGFYTLLGLTICYTSAAEAADKVQVGVMGAVNPNVSIKDGTNPRALTIGNEIYFKETISTDAKGTAQLLFLDKSALTVGNNASVTIDEFVYDPSRSGGELVIKGAKGAFRFIGGALSKENAVKIKTPVSTIGIRGGIVLVDINPDTGATNATFVYGKEMTITNLAGQTERVTNPGFQVGVLNGTTPPSIPVKVDAAGLMPTLNAMESKEGQTGGARIVPQEGTVNKSLAPLPDSGTNSTSGDGAAAPSEQGNKQNGSNGQEKQGDVNTPNGGPNNEPNGREPGKNVEGKGDRTNPPPLAPLKTPTGTSERRPPMPFPPVIPPRDPIKDCTKDGPNACPPPPSGTNPPPTGTIGGTTGGTTSGTTGETTGGTTAGTTNPPPTVGLTTGQFLGVDGMPRAIQDAVPSRGGLITSPNIAGAPTCSACGYANWGVWQKDLDAAGLSPTSPYADIAEKGAVPLVVTGEITQNFDSIAPQIPVDNNGKAFYSGNLVGRSYDGTSIQGTQGTFTSTIDVANRKLTEFTGTIIRSDNTQLQFNSGYQQTIQGTGAATFGGAVTGASVNGTMNGAFFGKNAEGIGGNYSIQNTSGTEANKGVFVGKR
ncbi:MAG: hypothetical protein K0R63_790 [Rickettsiales bacterium]|jgi:hypothetical protein|nr:hypothetical protein [Rickettsiales bacterium]